MRGIVSRRAVLTVAMGLLIALSATGVSHAVPMPYNGTDLRLWLRADAGMTLDTGTYPDRVLGWADQTGIGGNVTAEDGVGPSGARPLWVANGINGQPALWFDNTSRRIDGPAVLPAGDGARTIFVVANYTNPNPDSNGDHNRIIFDPAGQTPSAQNSTGALFRITPEICVRFGNGNVNFGSPVSTEAAIITAGLPAGGAHGDTVLYSNGIQLSHGSSSTNPINTTTDGYRMGTAGYTGYIAEVMVFEALLSQAEIDKVGSYLAGKYGIASSFAGAEIHWDNGSTDVVSPVSPPYPGDNLWMTPSNWRANNSDPMDQFPNDTLPGPTDRVNISLHDVATDPPVPCNVEAGDDLLVNSVRVGGNFGLGVGGHGVLNVNGGTLTIADNGGVGTGGRLEIGGTGNRNGTVSVAGGALNVGLGIITGASIGTGTSTLNYTGGTLNVTTGNIDVDTFHIEGVTYTHSTGTLDLGTLELGGAADGTLTQTGGTVAIAGDLVFGPTGVEGGTYNFRGGALTVAGNIVETAPGVDSAQFHLDADIDGGGAIFTVGGTITTQRFAVGEQAGRTGTYTLLTGKQLTTTGTLAVAGHGTGTFTLDGGTLQAANSIVAQYDEGIGTAHIDSGSFTVTGYIHLGAKGDGTLNINGGTVYFDGAVNIGHETGGKGTLNITGGDVTFDNNLIVGEVAAAAPGCAVLIDMANPAGVVAQTAGNILIGQQGQGRLDLVSGTLQTVNGVRVGNNPTGVGEMFVTGGTLDIGGNHIVVGNQGKGTLEITGGTGHTIASNLIIGNQNFTESDGAVTIDLPDNTHTLTANQVSVGVQGKGSLTFTEGTLNATSGFGLARNANASDHGGGDDRSATFAMGTPGGGTDPILNVSGGNFETAASGTGTVTLLSGTLDQQSNNIIIGQNEGSIATFNMQGGLVTMHNSGDLNFNDGQGTLDLDGGVFNVGRHINLSRGNGSATININPGGTLVVDDNIVYRGGGTDVINLQGGLLDMTGGNVTFANAGDQFNFTGGRLLDVGTFGGSLTQQGGTLAPGGSVGTTTIDGDYELQAAGILEIEIDATGADQLVVNGLVSLAGELDVLLQTLPDFGDEFLIIVNDAADPISGTFAGLPEYSFFEETYGGVTVPFRISYLAGDGNDVSLAAVPEPATLTLLALGGLGLAARRRRR